MVCTQGPYQVRQTTWQIQGQAVVGLNQDKQPAFHEPVAIFVTLLRGLSVMPRNTTVNAHALEE